MTQHMVTIMLITTTAIVIGASLAGVAAHAEKPASQARRGVTDPLGREGGP